MVGEICPETQLLSWLDQFATAFSKRDQPPKPPRQPHQPREHHHYFTLNSRRILSPRVHCTNNLQMPAKKAPGKKREAPEPSPTPSTPVNKRARTTHDDPDNPSSARKRQSSTAERMNLFDPPSDDEYAIAHSRILNPQALDVLRQVEVCLYRKVFD
jgi:hypothetical protein